MTILKKGVAVMPHGPQRLDIAFEKGVIADIGENIDPKGAEQVFDIEGRFVFPGFIDGHTHLDMDGGVTHTADDFESGTAAALCGGTTTIIDFATQNRGQSLVEALSVWHQKARGKSWCNYGFHMAVTDFNESAKGELPRLFDMGVTSFKAYMAYDALKLEDDGLYQLLKALKPLGGILGVHCENGALILALTAEVKAAGVLSPKGHPLSRPGRVEAEAVARLCAIANLVDAPVHIVHLSCQKALLEAQRARERGQKVYIETCPQYLTLDDSLYDSAGFEGAKYVISPPLRRQSDIEALVDAVKKGQIDTISTDHCSYNFNGQKTLGSDDFTRIPNGAPGLETRGQIVYTRLVKSGVIPPEEMANLLSTNPAKLFGMWPKKGALQVGADADLVVWDGQSRETIRAKTQKSACDYTPFEGMTVWGGAEMVFIGGRLCARSKELLGPKRGEYVKRSGCIL